MICLFEKGKGAKNCKCNNVLPHSLSTIIQQHKHESSATIPTLKISFYPFVKFLCFWESIVQSVQWIALYETISLCRGTTDKNWSRDEELEGTELNQSTTIAIVVTFLSHSTESKIRQQQSEIFI